MRIFVTRDLPGAALGRLRAEHDVVVWPGAAPPLPKELAQAASASDGLITLLTDRVDALLLDACPGVRAVSNYAVGFENVDLTAATTRGIAVGHTPGVLTVATAQLAITFVLDLLRQVSRAAAHVRAGHWRTWEPTGHLGASLSETTLGVVGMGRIGREVADLARSLEMNVIYTSRSTPGLSLQDVLAESDVVTLHAPLTPETLRLINASTLALMRPGSFLVNVARGAMVDTDALVDALRRGHLAGAALDVTDPEPLPADHPLLDFDNVIVTPHIASATVNARSAMADIAVDNLLAALAGRPMPHCANPDVYEPSGHVS